MSITHVQVLSIPVSDQDRAKRFYAETLGFTVLADSQFTPEMRWVMLAPPSGGTAITLVTWFPTMAPGSLKGTVLESDDLDADVAALRAKGVQLTDPETAPWGRFTTFDDPDGNGIVLQASYANAAQADASGWAGHAEG
jgi:catechol 2,3-dioxygenase-like lactoylglutathione lyase family enzyme